ncbi:MAG TPA: DUF885 domain-containing protein [Thermoanaerobaculia bacterium]|jgi:hypothetical protein|nr:DUF885 domain-containing protein [Thermoanaerobaculia bacterium]
MDPEAKDLQCVDVAAVGGSWDRLVRSFLDGQFEAHPTFAAGAGHHEYDGRLPDWSAEGIEGEIVRLRSERSRVAEFDPATLDERRAFEREVLTVAIDSDLFWLEAAEWHRRNPLFYAGPLDPNLYLTREYAPLAQRMRAYVDYARAVPRAAEQVRANLRTPMPRAHAELGEKSFSGLAGYFESDVPAVFAAVDDPGLQAQFRAANATAAKAMRELGSWFHDQISLASTAAEDFRLGADRFSRMLWETERVDVALEKLEEAGRRDLERNLAALREACAAYAPGLTVEACLAQVDSRKPAAGPVEAARRQLAGLRRFLEEKKLVTIPGSEEARVEEAPPYQRWNSAFIDIPGPYDRHLPSIYYIAPPDPSWTAEEQAQYIPGEADLLFVTIHEVWPGHFLQFLHSNRAESDIARLFVGYGFAEGWAHYAEELMWESGFGDGDPYLHIGQLQNALLRNVRYVVAIGLHTGSLTVEDAERMFRELAYQDPANARQQAARGTFDPEYLNYTLGKLMVRKLRADWTASRGGRAAWREFHDRFLSYGGPPVPLVRQAMLGEESGAVL